MNGRISKTSSSRVTHLVGIGASAGGLDAISKLLSHLPPQTGMAFFYVQHLSASFKSMLASLLSRHTGMRVVQARDGMLIENDHVFVIPPGKEMKITGMVIRLRKKRTDLTINTFFESLATHSSHHLFAIVLSGSASDGTKGLAAIKNAGGITMVQDNSAEFDSMPQSAISEGVVDFVLSPKNLAAKLMTYRNSSAILTTAINGGTHSEPEELNKIFKIILDVKGADFSQYKMSTVRRRISRRLQEHKLGSLKAYCQLLAKNKKEVEVLCDDLLINVTSFFRDAPVFSFLQKNILPKLLDNGSRDPIRIWVAGCATGQEAYSLGMILLELEQKLRIKKPFQIFATDLSERAITVARSGEYRAEELTNISPARLKRFFNPFRDKFRISKELREVCVFSTHNLISDAPFSKMDLITCCNMLIYLDAWAQKKVITSFHFGLKDDGILLLGNSETVGPANKLFSSIHKKFKLFARMKSKNNTPLAKLKKDGHSANKIPARLTLSANELRKHDPSVEAKLDALLLNGYVPATVVINGTLEVLIFRGDINPYIKLSGKASFDLLKIVKPQFAYELRIGIQSVLKTGKTIKCQQVEFSNNGESRAVTMEISMLEKKGKNQLVMIVFREVPMQVNSGTKSGSGVHKNYIKKIGKLEEELKTTRTEMQMIAQQQETVIEELQSANEEIVSSNEELRTVNEELETSKEEIEATNEELISSNRELQQRNQEVEELHRYSGSILATIPDPMLILNKDFIVRSANKIFCKNFRLKESEIIGKKLTKLSGKDWNIAQLKLLLNDALDKKSKHLTIEIAHHFKSVGDRILNCSARHVVQKSMDEKLLLLIMKDVTEQRRNEQLVQDKEKQLLANKLDSEARVEAEKKSSQYLESIFLNAPAAIAMTKGPQHKFKIVNNLYLQLIGNRKLEGRSVREAFPELEGQGYFELLDEVYKSGKPYIGNESFVKMDRGTGELSDGYFNFVYQPTYDLDGKIDGIMTHAVEVTSQVLTRKQIEANESQFTTLADNIQNLAWMADGTGWIYWYNRRWYEYTGTKPEDMEGWGWKSVHDPEKLPIVLERWEKSINTGEPFDMIFPIKGADGVFREFLTRAYPIRDEEKKVIRWIGTNTDVHEQKSFSNELEKAVASRTNELQESNLSLKNANEQLNSFNYISSHDLQEPLRKITTFSKLLSIEESQNLSTVGKDYLMRMLETVDRMQMLLEDLLAYSRASTNERNFEVANLNEQVDEVLKDLDEHILEKKAVIRKKGLTDLLVIPFQFRQMMQNLIGNALKFSDKKRRPEIIIEGQVTSVARNEEDKKDYFCVSISDNGIGFEPQYQNKIFDIFQRLHNRESYKGTGIGLAIVKKIVENHKGFITASGSPGKGARFEIYLPLQSTHAPGHSGKLEDTKLLGKVSS